MRCERGFSLLEVIAAMLLLAVAFGALMHVSGGSMRATSLVRARDEASMWADEKLEALGHTEPLVEGESSGQFDDVFAWTLRIVPVNGVKAGLALYQVDIDVSWREGAGRSHIKFTTMKIDDRIAADSHRGAPG